MRGSEEEGKTMEKPMFVRLWSMALAIGLSICVLGMSAANAAEVSTSNEAPKGYVPSSDVLPAATSITIPNGAVPEGEPDCYDDYVDVTNGGCNSEPPVFGEASCGQIIEGTSGTYLFDSLEYRDTDWFKVTLSQSGTISMTGMAEFPVQFAIVDGNSDCAGVIVIDYVWGDPGVETRILADVAPGTYYLWAGPQSFSGVDCGSKYYFEYNCNLFPIPTISFWGLLVLALTTAGLSLWMIRRRKMRA